MSISWHLDVEPKPAILALPPAAASLDEANAAIELWEFYKRRQLDDTQRLVVQLMMATTSDGLWAAATTGREMPRQNGKGDEIEVVEFWGLVQRAERILHTIHDAVLLASETQSRMLSLFDGHADLRRLKGRVWQGTGQQMIELRSGACIWYRTRTGGGARGVDEVDRVVIDEAQHAEPEHLAAVSPTMLASANPQLNALGTGGIEGRSKWWWLLRRRGLSGDSGRFGYMGHTAEIISLGSDGTLTRTAIDPNDRANWRKANPALLRRPELEAFLEEQQRLLGPELFAREHLGIWDPEPDDDGGNRPLSLQVWGSALDASSRVSGAVCLGLGASLNGASGSIGAVGRRADNLAHVEAVDVLPGLSWIPGRLEELFRSRRQKVTAVGADPGGPINAVLPDVEAVCDRFKVEFVRLSGRDYQGACAGFVRAVSDDLVRHVGQAWLSTAIGGATKRDIGVDGSWVWDLRPQVADVAPLVAVTIGLRLLESHKAAGWFCY